MGQRLIKTIVILKKHSCNSVWCGICFKRRYAPQISQKLLKWPWASVREVVISIDRKKFDTPEQCYQTITEKKALPQLMRDLVRYDGIKIIDWHRFLEWHSDGYPHWHIFVLVEKKGVSAKIGHEKLARRWRYGFVHERYIKDHNHWQNKMSYFGKTGYMHKNKSHQTRLPQWAMGGDFRIRRIGAKHKKGEEKKKNGDQLSKKLDRWDDKMKSLIASPEIRESIDPTIDPFYKPRKPYQIVLDDCGQSTIYSVMHNGIEAFGGVIQRPYRTMIKEFNGSHMPKIGYVIELGIGEFERAIIKITKEEWKNDC